jgi:succinate dehydrogenase / fumarate reductase iron-sulfur subunit
MGGSSSKTLNLKLKIWRQKNRQDEGRFEDYDAKGISVDASFLEMIDVVNNELIRAGKDPIAFDHDCREGICGSCAMVINGNPHGPRKGTTTCQLHMREFTDGETIVIEPWRAKAFPVIKDLMVDRKAFDSIIQSGGYISVNTGNAPDANALPIPKSTADLAFNAATCIGCGACVAACANGSAMLFVSAKLSHLNMLPQGEPEKNRRVLNMMKTMEEAGFGNCSNTGACALSCPKEISFENIASMNRDFAVAAAKARE